mgnify:FL=1|tara:strand:+ start:330 stop:1331 length:1002 start_codon:yes stop_codon:yes gene_type:complete
MAIDLQGMLTGGSRQIDPSLNMQQQQLALGANASDMMQQGVRSMRGQPDNAGQLQAQMSSQLANFQNLDTTEQQNLIGVLRATGQTALAGQLASGLTEKYSKGSTFTVNDEDGNDFIAIPTINSGSGEMEIQYKPIGGGAGQPVGKTKITGGDFALTAEQESKRKGAEEGAKKVAQKFGELKVESVALLPEMRRNMDSLQSSLKLLETVKTGGPINLAAYGMKEFFGLTGGDKAQLERAMAMSILQSLKPIFGGLISEGERKSLMEIGANVKRGNPANTAIIKSMIDRLNATADNALMYTTADNQEEYETLVKDMFKPKTPAEPKKTWQQLTR